ncbi:MAG: class I SAM-dependent methyltransferase [Flavobacteriales bacterium]|nr:class I SAM-dependent methyltransferase [Flavobacteriales bacterium]
MSSERQEINVVSPWWGEHVHRYYEVLKYIKGNEVVLDIACGTGFGSYLLSKATKSEVIGGDLSHEAIGLCNSKWKNSNLYFQNIDGANLSFADNYFDVVVSFETIEHTAEFNKMISEFKRVLKPNGFVFLSTPNFIVNSPTGRVTNPFHTQEWAYEEFVEILHSHFNVFCLYGQKYDRYGLNKPMGYYVEKLLYKRGLRKIPINIQDGIMKLFGQPSIYPLHSEFILVNESEEIKKCKTFFAICQK